MGRVAIVTGGTRGIGAAISHSLREMGFEVAANYGGDDAIASAFQQQTGIPTYKWDVADHEAVLAGVATVEANHGPVDAIINNAGITRDSTLLRQSYEQWKAVVDTNLGGCFNM